MTTSTINTHVNKQIVLDQGNYGNNLTVTKTGEVNGTTFAIYSGGPYADSQVQNAGLVQGGILGIELENEGTLINTGSVHGGVAGVVLGTSGSLNNYGNISGGSTAYGAANAAVYAGERYNNLAGAAHVRNSGVIFGQDIGLDIINAYASNTGRVFGSIAGAEMVAGGLQNLGDITGQTVGVELGGGTLANAGTISATVSALVLLGGAATNDSAGVISATELGVALRPTATSAITFTNDGLITGGTAGVYITASSLLNFGAITDTQLGVYLASGTVMNSGIIQANSLGLYLAAGYASNTGTLSASSFGAYIDTGKLLNTGDISAGELGVSLASGELDNAGSISGGETGVYLTGGLLATSGAISGGQYAVYGKNSFSINLTAGGSFTGVVKDGSGTGILNLIRGTPATLGGIGTSIVGFSNINIFYGGTWSLEGNLAALQGETISGFGPGTTLDIADFAASSFSFSPTGLVLTNGATTQALELQTNGGRVSVYTEHGATYLIAYRGPYQTGFKPVAGNTSIISGPVGISVTPGEGNYAAGVTITRTGKVSAKYAPAILTPSRLTGADIVNFGLVSSPAQDAISINGNVANYGSIVGNVVAGSGTLINAGQIDGSAGGKTLDNTGTITGGVTAGTLTNSSLITAAGKYGTGISVQQASLSAASDVTGSSVGAFIYGYSATTILNFGSLYGGQYGVEITNRYFGGGPGLTNFGRVTGKKDGVELTFGGTVTNAGTIAGATYAIYDRLYYEGEASPLDLIADPGAVFDGAVRDASDLGRLTLAAGTGSLDMGSSFTGFSTIDFAPGASWALEGAASALADGQTITGFAPGDTLILDGFSTGSYSFVDGSGLELVAANGRAAPTLRFGGHFAADDFSITSANGDTTINVLTTAALISTISTAFTNEITPGAGYYASDLTIAKSGIINAAAAAYAVSSTFASAYIDNAGTIESFDIGVNLPNGGTFINSGTVVAGHLARFGVYLRHGGYIENSGTIYGNFAGINLANGGTVVNSGTIAFQLGNGFYAALENFSGVLDLMVLPGADFQHGVIADEYATSQSHLTLGGATPGSLDMGASFTGFASIDFAAGSNWTLEGATSALAAGQAISGFAGGDTLILDGFSASSYSLVAGTGLVLSNATASETLALQGNLIPADFTVTENAAGGTVIKNLGDLIFNTSTLSGTFLGAEVNAGYTLVNSGGITATGGAFSATQHFGGIGVFVSGAGGGLVNTGSIFGYGAGVELTDGGSITNAGTIAAGANNPAIVNVDGAFTLAAEPGAAFLGQVTDDAGTGTLILAGGGAGSLDLTGFSGLPHITLAPGATWSLLALGDGETISGLAPADSLTLTSFTGPGSIDLAGFAATSSTVTAAGITLANASASETIALNGSYTSASFSITSDGAGGTTITDVACFCRGTRIATPRGNIAVENLAVGGLVKTTRGPAAIKWIGTRAYAGRFIAGNRNALPICIRRHAIAFNIPARDLYLSPDHAICEGGVLVHAHLLVNGVSITQVEAVDSVEYFHIELENHGILFAENLPTESFIDENARHRFANAHTAPASAPQKPCLPRVAEGFHLHNIKSRIARRAGIAAPVQLGPLRGCIDDSTPTLLRGWAQDMANPESPVLLEIFSGGLPGSKTPEIFSTRVLANAYRPDLRDAGLGSGCHGFAVTLPNLRGAVTIRRAGDGARLPEPRDKQAVAFL